MRWTPARAARLGYLAGRGASLHAVLQDMGIGAAGAQSLRNVATRWGLRFGREARSGPQDAEAPLLSVPLPSADREALAQAAAARGLSVASFVATLVHTITAERLIGAVLDDGRD
jgi:hypothetical protein